MGVVYKAEDTKLERSVALKFLAHHLLDDDEAKERFLREAKAAAAIDHPNICHVHEIGDEDGKTFIAMAFLEGESLEDRIANGPLSLKDALEIARQVADGLQAAHTKGVFHRDIKPANIIISPEGRATIMDFGLARLTEASRLTKADTAMGTVAYMSPEQAQGMEVDSRTDIWALGCVLYEMVSGQRPFQGQYDQALLYEIVHEEPAPLTGLRTGVPVELEFAVGKCLEKDADSRYQHTADTAVDLRNLQDKLRSGRSTILRTAQMTGAVPAMMTTARTVNPTETLPPDVMVVRRISQRALQALATLLTIAVLGLSFAYLSTSDPDAEPRALRRFSFSHVDVGSASISPDGRNVAYSARAGADSGSSSLWLRSMGNETVREIPGTAGVVWVRDWTPAWSADSRSIVFGTRDQLKLVSLGSGDSIVLCPLPGRTAGREGFPFTGASFSPEGDRIVFSSRLRLWEVSTLGGEPKLLFEPDPNQTYWSPLFLPASDGSPRLVFSVSEGNGSWRTEAMDLLTGKRHQVAPGSYAVYAPNGYLIHGPSDPSGVGLSATPFSIETLSVTGETLPLERSGRLASVSQDGILVYTETASSASERIVVKNRSGEVLRSVGDPIERGQAPAVAPDGKRAAVGVEEDIWVYDLDRDIGARLTFSEGANLYPSWLPSSVEVSYAFGDGVAVQVADGSQEARQEFTRTNGGGSGPASWSADGRYVAYAGADPAGGEGGIWYREIGPDGSLSEPISYLRTPHSEGQPQISPDGRYLAHRSDESGRQEVYVRSFPEGAGKWQVSMNGGVAPRWAANGSEIFYWSGAGLMAADVSTAGTFTFGRRQLLFEAINLQAPGIAPNYDVFPDGQRFLTIDRDAGGTQERVRIVENWDEPFRDQAQ